jgi:hypothetical protein
MQELFRSLLGGGQQQQESQDFIQRYQQGPPAQGYSDQEVLNRYQQVASQVPPDVYQQSAEQAFARMSPQERQEFAAWMQQRAQQQNVQIPDLNGDGVDDRLQQDPHALAQATTQVQQQQPGFLGQLFGGGGGGNAQGSMPQMNTAQKAALAGIAALALKTVIDNRRAA